MKVDVNEEIEIMDVFIELGWEGGEHITPYPQD